ncbi:PAS domain-containing protein [Streptomyces sp. RLB3-17]|uniref:PAS domain-containing protein n=1 Tax=Streptomyces sp. RLB3-17 TaxID=2594455 RepID=UPI0021F0B0D7|nr:PAS domain-containing protein [Streptomyces sp. RLB3-17]
MRIYGTPLYGTPQGAEVAAAAVDAQVVVTAWSRGARLLLGYAPGEVVGRPASKLLAVGLPDSARRSLARREACLGRVALRNQAGRPLEADVRACPLTDAEKQSSGSLRPPFRRRAARVSIWCCNAVCSRITGPPSWRWRRRRVIFRRIPRPVSAVTGSMSSLSQAPAWLWSSATSWGTAYTPPPPWDVCAPRYAPSLMSTFPRTSC